MTQVHCHLNNGISRRRRQRFQQQHPVWWWPLTLACHDVGNDTTMYHQQRSLRLNTAKPNSSRMLVYPFLTLLLLLLHVTHTCTAFMVNVVDPSAVRRTVGSSIDRRITAIIPFRRSLPIEMSTTSSPSSTTTITTNPKRKTVVARGKTGSRVIASVEEYMTTILQTPHRAAHVPNEEEEEEFKEEKPILLFWTAPWCGPCRLSIPIVKDVRQTYRPVLSTYEICTDDVVELPEMVGITSVPTIQLYYQGKLYDTIIGCVSQQVLSASIEKVLEEVQKLQLLQQHQRHRQ